MFGCAGMFTRRAPCWRRRRPVEGAHGARRRRGCGPGPSCPARFRRRRRRRRPARASREAPRRHSSGSSPPDRNHGFGDEKPSRTDQSKATPMAARTGRVPRRLGVEEQAIGLRSSATAARSSRAATPIAFITGTPVVARIALTRSGVSLPCSCRRSGRSVVDDAAKQRVVGVDGHRHDFAPCRGRAPQAPPRAPATRCAGSAERSTNPTKSAPASSAASTPSSSESPQILTSVGMPVSVRTKRRKSRIPAGAGWMATARWNFPAAVCY